MEKYLYKEVYVVGPDSTVSDSGELVVLPSFEDLLSHLTTKSVSINSDLRVLHGVLTPARAIPSDLKGRQAFILLKDKDQEDHGVLLDSDSDDDYMDLAGEIEGVLDSEEIASFFYEIDDVFILYGYEISLVLSVDEEEIDETVIADCLRIAQAARNLDPEE
jgi:hypothetical protein